MARHPFPGTLVRPKAPPPTAQPLPDAPPGSASVRPAGKPLWLIPWLALAVAAGIGGWMAVHKGSVETDDAQVQASLTQISSRVGGTISLVAVADNQTVAAGALLVALDDRDARTQLQLTEANLREAERQAAALTAQTGSTASAAQAAGSQARADQEEASAELIRSGAELRRLEFLLSQGGVSQQDVDRARATYRQALGQRTRSVATAQQARSSDRQVGVDTQKASAARARIDQFQASVAAARLQLSYTRLLAPVAGRIGARQAEPGRQVQTGQPLMLLVGAQPWVEAHFKETQLEALRAGKAAEIRLDAFPGRVFAGHIVSLAPASGARFALLPPDNATGNFTKVVQRVTARIAFDERSGSAQLPAAIRQQLVPGLSASVRVQRS
ncbi:HlyD family secretion protein [Synechococcus sp. Tobar12-5m-g]|uniref:HlyD family secretion protein n=1 Tax=unclassified Synechococcus TaxID=2626047 RepID=UPI0020CFA3BB|nr:MULTISPECIES: HlyD family secretion protein [unclassified Synechococcus]MCP9772035.1 HlyD family secretion protein [Synechococcus sp. Tobar12-5m-g]MCP9872977.1 HlyD family secretion protein [Synechococcus sp. Cruz CV-v-12]